MILISLKLLLREKGYIKAMMLCLCHPFSDKDAAKHMRETGEKCRVADVYKACTGGEKPNCASCMCLLKEMVKDHNASLVTAKTETA